MSGPAGRTGSRFLYEPFDSAHARIEVHEKVTEERWQALERRLLAIEGALDRLERRIWLAVYGVATVMVSQVAWTALMKVSP
ncbi:MAG: hypothetical protein KatS3mg118_1108 [Paracoccaceae bacterium]|nr:MAG: hypothetical protein D6686_01100 [Alphaproteobacteria bacterium]GIX13149.1 MAG: hypothetical protein KatS3mg118_1108 [Paracoccaceae bacterium]